MASKSAAKAVERLELKTWTKAKCTWLKVKGGCRPERMNTWEDAVQRDNKLWAEKLKREEASRAQKSIDADKNEVTQEQLPSRCQRRSYHLKALSWRDAC